MPSVQRPLPTVRCKVTPLDDFRIRYICPEGHETIENINKGRPKHLRLSKSTAAQLIRWWGKTGVAFHCPECFKERR